MRPLSLLGQDSHDEADRERERKKEKTATSPDGQIIQGHSERKRCGKALEKGF